MYIGLTEFLFNFGEKLTGILIYPFCLAHSPSRNCELALSMTAARILSPSSKLALSSGLAAKTATDTLSDVLNVTDATEDELYGAMDWLIERQDAI